jgi:parvulin-like peptidyl-prolyl isomerase
MEAQINAFKRKQLADLFWREIAKRAVISEAEAKKYFAENAARIRTELRVWQILRRKESLIDQALNDLEQGTSFEEVAGRQFPKLPKTAGAPWDLGYLRWKQVPKAWRNVVYDLKKGEVSGVIRGPNNRFWIIKLIDKRENPDITFESIKPTIMEVLKNAKIEELREKTDRDLRAKASIVYLKGPVEASEE